MYKLNNPIKKRLIATLDKNNNSIQNMLSMGDKQDTNKIKVKIHHTNSNATKQKGLY